MMDWFKGFDGKPGEIVFIDHASDLGMHSMPMGVPNRTTQAQRRRRFRNRLRAIRVAMRRPIRSPKSLWGPQR